MEWGMLCNLTKKMWKNGGYFYVLMKYKQQEIRSIYAFIENMVRIEAKYSYVTVFYRTVERLESLLLLVFVVYFDLI